MAHQDDSHYRDNTSSANRKKDEILNPFVIRPDEVYSQKYLTQVMQLSKDTWSKWHKRGLKKLNTNTKQALYFGQDIISIWRSPT